jgi:hypothetical protein
MGAAVVGMHYTGIAAATFTHAGENTAPSHDLNTSILGFGIGTFTLVILGLALISAFIDRRFSAQAAQLEDSEARYTRIVANAPGMVYQMIQRADGSIATASSRTSSSKTPPSTSTLFIPKTARASSARWPGRQLRSHPVSGRAGSGCAPAGRSGSGRLPVRSSRPTATSSGTLC